MPAFVLSLIYIILGACSGVCLYHRKWNGVFFAWMCILFITFLDIFGVI